MMKTYKLENLLLGKWYISRSRLLVEGQIVEAHATDLYAGENYRVYKVRFGDSVGNYNWATVAIEIGE